MATKQQQLVDKAAKMQNLKSAVATNAKGMEGKVGEAREAYRPNRKYC